MKFNPQINNPYMDILGSKMRRRPISMNNHASTEQLWSNYGSVIRRKSSQRGITRKMSKIPGMHATCIELSIAPDVDQPISSWSRVCSMTCLKNVRKSGCSAAKVSFSGVIETI